MKSQSGQSLVELLIAIGVFVLVISSITFLVIDSYVSGRLSKEITQANFLAEEGIEAAISIRDNSWDNLSAGTHGLAISGNNWILQGTQEDLSGQLNQGIRTITIEDIDADGKKVISDRKRVISEVVWELIETRPQQIQLVTYLTNWQKISAFCQGTCTPCSGLRPGPCMRLQEGCSWDFRNRVCVGACAPCESFLDRFSCRRQRGCSWTNP